MVHMAASPCDQVMNPFERSGQNSTPYYTTQRRSCPFSRRKQFVTSCREFGTHLLVIHAAVDGLIGHEGYGRHGLARADHLQHGIASKSTVRLSHLLVDTALVVVEVCPSGHDSQVINPSRSLARLLTVLHCRWSRQAPSVRSCNRDRREQTGPTGKPIRHDRSLDGR